MNFRFVLSRQWLGYLALTIIFAAACSALGTWQLDRRADVVAKNSRIAANYSAAPADLATAAPWLQSFDRSKEWTPVQLNGQYLSSDTRVVRNRPLNGQPGYEVLVPFRTSSGETVIIDRGWLPIGNRETGRPDEVPNPPEGDVTVIGRLKGSEPKLQRDAPEGQIASINLQDYAQQLSYPIATGSYLQIAQENPPPAQALQGFLEPTVDEGPHLSYALQWFAFAVLCFIALGYVAVQQARINRELEEDAAELGTTQQALVVRQPAMPRQQRNLRKKGDAEAAEDALLDAQGFDGGAPMEPERRA